MDIGFQFITSLFRSFLDANEDGICRCVGCGLWCYGNDSCGSNCYHLSNVPEAEA